MMNRLRDNRYGSYRAVPATPYLGGLHVFLKCRGDGFETIGDSIE